MSRTTPTLAEKIDQVNERLEEIEKERKANSSDPQIETNEELIAEEHRLQNLLQQLTDQLTEEGEGLAEEMVKGEAANADEIPDLPPASDSEPEDGSDHE